jgi:hypothetical protein
MTLYALWPVNYTLSRGWLKGWNELTSALSFSFHREYKSDQVSYVLHQQLHRPTRRRCLAEEEQVFASSVTDGTRSVARRCGHRVPVQTNCEQPL